jgi:hypothetical protein
MSDEREPQPYSRLLAERVAAASKRYRLENWRLHFADHDRANRPGHTLRLEPRRRLAAPGLKAA